MSDRTATLSAGDLVGNYRILGLAGAGGMGVVYRALDVKLERTVALKFLPEHLASSADDRERFLREARTASSLDHPNIGVIHGLDETGDGRTFIVMAYYVGETLVHKIRSGSLTIGEAVDIAIQMGEGLAAAHAGTVVVVAINNGSSSATVPITISGGTTTPASMTPTVTSLTDNLASGTAVTVTGGSFTASLASMTVTTFGGK